MGTANGDRPSPRRPAGAAGFRAFRRELIRSGQLDRTDGDIVPQPARHRPSHARPNIIWIMADQLRADTFSFLGHPCVKTPNIDRLAAKGVSFSRAYCSSPVCGPSRACTLTGRYLFDHGVLDNQAPMNPSEVTLPELLAQAGYRTVNIGKVHCGRPGQEIWHEDVTPRSRQRPFEPREYAPALFFGHENGCYRANNLMSGRNPLPVEDSKSYLLSTEANRWLYENQDTDQPICLRISYDDPHPPIAPPEPFCDMYHPDELPPELFVDMRESLRTKPAVCGQFATCRGCDGFSESDHRRHAASYLGLVSHLDAQIGRVLDYVEESRMLDGGRTILMLTSDHGHMIGEHGLASKGIWQYEGVSRVPMIVAWPGVLPAGERTDSLFDGTDLLPTLLDLIGLPVPQTARGVSHAPVLRGRAKSVRQHAYSQWEDYGFAVIGSRYKLCIYDACGPKPAWTTPTELLDSLVSDNAELYDLHQDPLERHNLLAYAKADHRQTALGLCETMLDWLADTPLVANGRACVAGQPSEYVR